MSVLLAFLDRVIDELQPDAAADTSREKWRKSSILPVAPAPETGAGTPNPLTEQRLPVLPVVPVTKQDIYELDAQIEKKTGCEFWQKENRPYESLSKSTGSTGSTGSFEGFCGLNTSRANESHGKSDAVTGSFEADGGFPGDEDPIGACDERAAIIELGAGVPRAWAEGYAALCAMPPPAGFLPARWQRIVDAAGVFVDRWAAKAAGRTSMCSGATPTAPMRGSIAWGSSCWTAARSSVSMSRVPTL